ncbi:FkbM family methyltransferase [Oceanicola sp. 502str15]|uniref:FkbM family methyltransferase n=1 Tax=Oceanicola sp. 502str15 TaxID=2696061 RepID=UPI002094DD05|nr:FkbM family methyltransferase [Oceanicola sp. 502str15]MCO6381941.1 FkbM family methyltransferase [Oceanicola sp. 502str15]
MTDEETENTPETGVLQEETETTRRINALRAGDELHPAVVAALGNGVRFVSPRQARVVLSHRYGKPVIFTVDNREDRIHKNHLKGRFYEQQQLETIASHFPEGGTFMDVGANVGNHTLYMALMAGAARVLPVEPNPKAINLLVANVMYNGLFDRVDLSTLGYGLDAEAGEGLAIHSPRNNLGWVKLKPVEEAKGDATAVPTRTGDSLVGDTHVDFIKIDVEGMEVGALKGLEGTITRSKPHLFIELEHVNKEAAWEMLEAWGYETVHDFEANKTNQNILLKPKS